MNAIERFRYLAEEADITITNSADVTDVIPFCIEALRLIGEQPGLRPQFVVEFSQMKYSEFPSVCVHVLRWPELKEVFEKQYKIAIESNDWRAEPFIRHVLEAFEDNWSDAEDIYGEFFGKTPPNG